jgi:hypothetical protein
MGGVNRRIVVLAGQGINVRPYFKNTQYKRIGGMAQLVEHLPTSKHKALSSNPNTVEKKKDWDI